MQSYWGNEKRSLSVFPVQQAQTTTSGRSAGVMAAVSAGAYVANSNRVRGEGSTIDFGGGGFIVDPSGKMPASTSKEKPIAIVKIEEEIADAAKLEYPAYVSDDHLTGQPI